MSSALPGGPAGAWIAASLAPFVTLLVCTIAPHPCLRECRADGDEAS